MQEDYKFIFKISVPSDVPSDYSVTLVTFPIYYGK